MELKHIHNDIEVLKRDMAVIKHILSEEGELTEEAEKRLPLADQGDRCRRGQAEEGIADGGHQPRPRCRQGQGRQERRQEGRGKEKGRKERRQESRGEKERREERREESRREKKG